jgi:hypothetical protein
MQPNGSRRNGPGSAEVFSLLPIGEKVRMRGYKESTNEDSPSP